MQDGLDRELVRHYRPGADARGLLVCATMCETANAARHGPRGEFGIVRDYVHYSQALVPCIEQRWRELGYASCSAYVTGLIRYDLLLLGPHKYYNGDDCGSERMAELDAMTAAEFETAGEKLTYLERLVEEVAGRKLTSVERDAAMRDLVTRLREWAMRPRKMVEEPMLVGRSG